MMGEAAVDIASKFPKLKTHFSVALGSWSILDIVPTDGKELQGCVKLPTDVKQHLATVVMERLVANISSFESSTEAGVVHRFLPVSKQ